jgi:hypothetical protein
MTERPASIPLRKLVPDAVVGLTIFLLIFVLTAGDTTIAAPSSYADHVFVDTTLAAIVNRPASLVLLTGVFSALVTFNLAFVRHLCRAYASHGRDMRERGRWPGVAERSS